jgi:anti-sigma regulatory factor (Ser/Thr protein kinase)
MQNVVVRLSGGYYFHTLTRIIRDLQPLLTLTTPALITIDMSALTFMGPAALALTAAVINRLTKSGLTVEGSEILAPRARGMYRYLHRMDFFRLVVKNPSLPDEAGERHDTRGFRECRQFVTDEECRRVAKSLADSAGERVRTMETASYSLYTCLTELAENVYYHADTRDGGVATAQDLPKSGEIELAIVDLGVGIYGSLTKNVQYAGDIRDDLAAIRWALTPTVSATPDRNSGYGLFFAQALLRTNGGRLLVRSGRGHVQRGAKQVDRLEVENLPGTLVGFRLRTDRPFDAEVAWSYLDEALRNVPNLLNEIRADGQPR